MDTRKLKNLFRINRKLTKTVIVMHQDKTLIPIFFYQHQSLVFIQPSHRHQFALQIKMLLFLLFTKKNTVLRSRYRPLVVSPRFLLKTYLLYLLTKNYSNISIYSQFSSIFLVLEKFWTIDTDSSLRQQENSYENWEKFKLFQNFE